MKFTIKDVVNATTLALFNYKKNFIPGETTIEENRNLIKPYFADDIELFGDDPLSEQEVVEFGAHALRDCIKSLDYTSLAYCREEIRDILCNEDEDFKRRNGKRNQKQELIDKMNRLYIEVLDEIDNLRYLLDNTQKLTSGKWIADRYCSICEWDKQEASYTRGWEDNYCPNCGAKMKE